MHLHASDFGSQNLWDPVIKGYEEFVDEELIDESSKGCFASHKKQGSKRQSCSSMTIDELSESSEIREDRPEKKK